MKLSSFSYLCKQGWRSMVANRLMTFASIGVLTACLVITGIAALLGVNVSNFVDYLGSQNSVEVYISKDAAEADITALGQKIEAMDNVAHLEFISKEQALSDMMERMGDNADLLESYLTTDAARNPLSESYRVTVEDIAQLAPTVEKIRQMGTVVDSIESPSSLAQILVNMQRAVTYGGWGLVVVLGLVSVVVISNTIRLTCFARRKEINIMKFVGATNTFIRLPFFVEGMTVGALAGLVATGLICGLYYAVLQFFNSPSALWLAEFTRCFYSVGQVWLPLLGGFVLFGMAIGGIGCATSIRKHLKV